MTAQSPALPSELFQKIVDEARDAVVVVDSAGRYVLANRAAADIYGMTPVEMIGRPIGTFSVDAQGTWELARAFTGTSDHRGEHRIYRPDGTSIDVEYTGTANVLPGLHVAILRDVTAAKQQAREHERTARRYRELFANASDVVYTCDMNGLLTEVNGAVERVLGYTEEELLGKRFSTLLPAGEVPNGVAMKNAILADEHRTASQELTLRHRDGHYVETEVSARLMTCGEGKPTGFHGIVRDISERKRLERELRETAQRYIELFEEASDVIFRMDLDGNLLQLNGASERLFGWTGEELAGRNIRELMPPAYWPTLASPVERMARTPGEVVVRQYEMIGKNGGRVSVEVTSRVLWRDGKPVAVHGVARDISERLEAERKVQESEARFRAVMNALPCGVWVWDGAEVTFVNPAMAEIAGRSLEDLPQDDESKSFLSLFEPEDAEKMLRNGEQRLAGGNPPDRYEVRLRRPDGELRWLDIHCTVVSRDGKLATVTTAFDVTDRHLAEQERQEFDARMQHTQKLESLGVLAGGVAHDFNNLLVGIMGNAELALMDLANRDLLEDTLTQIRTAARRAGELTRQLLAYSGKGKFVVEPTDLSALVREMSQLVEVSTSKHARVHVDAPDGLPVVAADAGQLRQVAMNLIINASDALGDEPGDIWVRTGTVALDADAAAAICPAGELQAGDYVLLEVRDTGCGMDSETQRRLFEPFFTTKFTGRGLGLAAVQGIVRSHRGAIRVQSAPGKGATFTVVLPVHNVESGTGGSVDDGPGGSGWRGHGRVLVVDDDDVVRAVVVRMLGNAGFDVEAVPDGYQALDAMERAPEEFALAVVDLTMPGMDGGATLDLLRALRPGLPAVVISGFAEQEATERVRFDARTSFVQKPFAQGDLLRTIEAMIRAQHG